MIKEHVRLYKQLKEEIKYEIEEEIAIDQIPSLYANSTWYQRIFFGWSFPIIKIGNERQLKYSDLGGLKTEDLVQQKIEKVEALYEAQE